MPISRGRPRTSLLERLRVIYWSHQVLAASGMGTADGFETLFAKANGPVRIARGSWSRYLRGEISPQGATDDASAQSLVARLGKRYPGTAEVFHHPIWQLLKFEEWYSPTQLREMYLQLSAQAWHQFVATKKRPRGGYEPGAPHFWRVGFGILERVDGLKNLSGLDGIAASLIEARMEYLAQAKSGFLKCIEVAIVHLDHLSSDQTGCSWRLHSCHLLLEAYCLGFALYCTQSSGVEERERDAQDERVQQLGRVWQKRFFDHLERLSPSHGEVARTWAREIFSLTAESGLT